MINLAKYEVWFLTGSQHLYGSETLKQVDEHSQRIVNELNKIASIPINIKFKPVLVNPSSIKGICYEANQSKLCIGIITWMHTFSPAKMWIAGLKVLDKPIAHLHTQFNRDIPYNEIDMDFMNLNQSAHGGREFGFICSRMGIERKVIVGHWKDENVHKRLSVWMRAAAGWADLQNAKIARFGDNMREVAVTEGDKVEAQVQFGYSVNGYGVGDLVSLVDQIDNSEIDKLVSEYEDCYDFESSCKKGESSHFAVRDAAQIELGIRAFLETGEFTGFTTTFEDLNGLKQLPGIAVQRLMSEGYGFGAEGDWKTSALLRAMKVMSFGLDEGTSFMEDYTYHLEEGNMQCLGSHMLEICPSIANSKPRLEVHPLSIGGKNDPARLVFDVGAGDGINVSIIDMGNRFRMIVNEVEVLEPTQMFPKLPVARVMWNPKPNLEISAGAWIHGGGAHHTVFSKALTSEYLEDFAAMANLEFLLIDSHTNVRNFKNELKWNSVYYK